MENSAYISAASHAVELPVGETSTAKWNGVKVGSVEVEGLGEDSPPSGEDSPEEFSGRQTWGRSMEDQHGTVKVRRATSERPNKAEQTLHKEVTSLKQRNSDLLQELRKKKDESRHLHDVTGRLCTAVDREADTLQFLSKEMESISSELHQEQTWRLQLSHELQQCRNTLGLQTGAERSPDGAAVEDKDYLTAEPQKERNWRLQARDELKEYTNVPLRKYQVATSTEETKAHCQTLVGVPDEEFRISTALLTELKQIESCSEQKAAPTRGQQREHRGKPPQSDNSEGFLSMTEMGGLHQMFENLRNDVTELSDILEEEVKKKKKKESLTAMPGNYQTHQKLLCEEEPARHVTRVESDEEEDLRMTNLLLHQQLHVQSGVIADLKAETAKLSHRLEMEAKRENSLSRLRQSDVAQLRQEKEWRTDLIYQLEKQVFDHQQELKALHQSVSQTQGLLRELEALKRSNSKLHTQLHLQEELCHHFQTMSLRLTANLQSEKRRNHSLADVLRQEQRCHGCQGEEETPQEAAGANSREKCVKQTRDFFPWRRNKSKRQMESPL